MAHQPVAFSASITGTGALEYVAPVVDQTIRPSGNGIIVPSFNNIIGGIALPGTGGTLGKLISPSLRARNPYTIFPAPAALVPSGLNYAQMHPQSPIPLVVDEEVDAQVDQNDATAEQVSLVAFLAPGAVAAQTPKCFPVAFTITCALLAGAWQFTPISFVDDLPVGTYDIVGGSLVAADGIAWRLVFVGGGLRPGAPVHQALAEPEYPLFRWGGLNVWGSFQTVQPPSIEILASADVASATYKGVLDLVQH